MTYILSTLSIHNMVLMPAGLLELYGLATVSIQTNWRHLEGAVADWYCCIVVDNTVFSPYTNYL